MKRHWITYHEQRKRSPMSFWVHVPIEASRECEPPLPRVVPGRGYAYYHVEIDGFTWEFASLDELQALIETFSRKLLPSNLQQSMQRGGTYGPSRHWLNRVPKETTTWRYRQKAVRYLQLALKSFAEQTR